MLEKLLLSVAITFVINTFFVQLGWSSTNQKSLELHQQAMKLMSHL